MDNTLDKISKIYRKILPSINENLISVLVCSIDEGYNIKVVIWKDSNRQEIFLTLKNSFYNTKYDKSITLEKIIQTEFKEIERDLRKVLDSNIE